MQHIEDVTVLHAQRTALIGEHVTLSYLQRFDERLAAHLDGLNVIGEAAWPLCQEELEMGTAGAMFAAAIRAISDRRLDRIEQLCALAETVPETQPGLKSALGWVEPAMLRGLVVPLLNSSDALRRTLGIAASALHRLDPGLLSARRLEDPEPSVRARALRTAGEIGKVELVSALANTINDEDPVCQAWGAWSAVLLGNRQAALEFLKAAAFADGPMQPRAFQLAMQALPVPNAHALLQTIARDPAKRCMLIQGAGLIGDPAYVPWLIGQMADDALARVAGEAFNLIAGADLELLDLERNAPETAEGPNDDPEDDNVAMDEDDSLPWPDPKLVQAWWTHHCARFASGTRYLVGSPVTRHHCIDVLKNGYQRQRIAAAYHLCLLNPGTPLFEWRAPAWRQQRELAQMA